MSGAALSRQAAASGNLPSSCSITRVSRLQAAAPPQPALGPRAHRRSPASRRFGPVPPTRTGSPPILHQRQLRTPPGLEQPVREVRLLELLGDLQIDVPTDVSHRNSRYPLCSFVCSGLASPQATPHRLPKAITCLPHPPYNAHVSGGYLPITRSPTGQIHNLGEHGKLASRGLAEADVERQHRVLRGCS